MKLTTCVALVLATVLLHGAAMPVAAAGSMRPVQTGQGVSGGSKPHHHRHVGNRHGHIRPAFRFAGFGYAPSYRYDPAIVINNRVVINVTRPGAVQTMADLPVVMGIRRQPAADPVIHQVGRSFDVAGLQEHRHPGQRRSMARSQWSESSRIIVVRGF